MPGSVKWFECAEQSVFGRITGGDENKPWLMREAKGSGVFVHRWKVMGDLGSPTSSIYHLFRTRPPQNQQTTVTKFDIVSFPYRRRDEVVEAMSSLSRRIATSLPSILPADSHQLYVNTPAPAPMSTTLFTQGHAGDVRITLLPATTYERPRASTWIRSETENGSSGWTSASLVNNRIFMDTSQDFSL